VVALLDEAIARKDMAEWAAIFHQQDVIWGLIPAMDGVAADPQMQANGVFAEFEHPEHGHLRTVNSPLNVQGITKEKPQPSPGVGQHSRDVLRSLGYKDAEIDGLTERGVTMS
jgi:formyl-CoA transferase